LILDVEMARPQREVEAMVVTAARQHIKQETVVPLRDPERIMPIAIRSEGEGTGADDEIQQLKNSFLRWTEMWRRVICFRRSISWDGGGDRESKTPSWHAMATIEKK
jgi:hypothetical protein